jgi:hypothetical protein
MKPPKTNSDQAKRFREAAQLAECDDAPEAFERVFAQIVPPKAGKSAETGKPKSKKPSR